MVIRDLEHTNETDESKMAKKAISRLPALLKDYMDAREDAEWQKGNKEFRMSLLKVSQEIGIPYSSAQRWAKGQVDYFTGDMLGSWCEYLGCDIADLLVLVDKDE